MFVTVPEQVMRHLLRMFVALAEERILVDRKQLPGAIKADWEQRLIRLCGEGPEYLKPLDGVLSWEDTEPMLRQWLEEELGFYCGADE